MSLNGTAKEEPISLSGERIGGIAQRLEEVVRELLGAADAMKTTPEKATHIVEVSAALDIHRLRVLSVLPHIGVTPEGMSLLVGTARNAAVEMTANILRAAAKAEQVKVEIPTLYILDAKGRPH